MTAETTIKEPKRDYWYFTFGCGQEHAHTYVKIFGTFGEARTVMFDKYGPRWSFQYSAQEFKGLPEKWHWTLLEELGGPA